MSLNYDLTGVEGWTALNWSTDVEPVIFATMSTGIGRITRENYMEFAFRYNTWLKANGWDPAPVSMIEKMVGLKTNVGFETNAKWQKRFFDNQRRDFLWNNRKA